MFTPDEAAARVADVVADALGEVVTGWVLVAATITNDGEQACWNLSPPAQPDWSTMGLLEWGRLRTERSID